MSKHINWIDLLSNALEIGRTSLFIQVLGVIVRFFESTVMMKWSIVDRFKYITSVGSPMEGLDLIRVLSVINTSDRSRRIAIRRLRCAPRAFHQDHYNS